MNRGKKKKKKGCGKARQPRSANKSRDLAGGQEGAHRRREANSASTCVFGAEVLLLGPERGRRAEIRAQIPGTKRQHFHARTARCWCRDPVDQGM